MRTDTAATHFRAVARLYVPDAPPTKTDHAHRVLLVEDDEELLDAIEAVVPCQRLCRRGRTHTVLGVSAAAASASVSLRCSDSHGARARAAGIREFLPKPLDGDALIGAVERYGAHRAA